MSKRRNIFKYVGISYLNVGLNVVLSLLLINQLSTQNFGKVSIGKTIFQSFEFSHIGIRNGFDRLFPSIKNDAFIKKLFSSGFVANLIVSALFVLFWLLYKQDDILFYLCFSLGGVIYSLTSLYKIYFRTKDDKKEFVTLSAYLILLPTIGQLLGFLVFSLWGLVIAFLLSYILVLAVVFKKYSIKIEFKRNKFFLFLKRPFKKGWLIYLTGIVTFFSTSGDKFFIENFWGYSSVGRFSVIMFFFSIFIILSVNYTEMFMNRIIVSQSLKYAGRHIMLLSVLILLLITLTFFLLPLIINIFMPKYQEDVYLMRIMLMGVLPYSLRSILYFYMHSIDKRKILFFTELIASIVYFSGLLIILTVSHSLVLVIYLKIAFYIITVSIIGGYALYNYKTNLLTLD